MFDWMVPTLQIVIGVSFIIFMHELGHFMVAKRAGVRVDAFSLGMGPVICSFRKGLGFRWGSAVKEYEELLRTGSAGRAPGQTEYRISWVPIGGYVKMAGETVNDEHTGAHDELQSQSTGVRLAIFSAGSAMNLLIAIPLLTAAALLGISYTAPVIGSIAPTVSGSESDGSDEWDSELQVGDEILSVNGEPVTKLEDYHHAVVFHPNQTLHVRVRRGTETRDIEFITRGAEHYGVSGAVEPVVDEVIKDSPADRAGLKSGDRVVSIGGEPTPTWETLVARIHANGEKPVEFVVERPVPGEPEAPPETLHLTLTPEMKSQPTLDIEPVVPARVFSVKGGGPAKAAGILKADVISAVDGVPCRTLAELRARLKPMIGLPVKLTVTRNQQTVETTLTPARSVRGEADIGVYFAGFPTELADAPADTPFGKAGLKAGDVLIRAVPPPRGWLAAWMAGTFGSDPAPFNTLDNIYRALRTEKNGDLSPLLIEYSRSGVVQQTTIEPDSRPVPRAGLNMGKARVKSVRVAMGLGDAFVFGLTKAWDNIVETFEMLRQLFSRAISPKNLAGPIGIFHISYRVAEEGLPKLLQLLALLTVNLGIVNMFPIPLLDGGHVFFLICERIKGKPLSEGTQVVAQYIGLALLLTLVIFVTVQDVGRLF